MEKRRSQKRISRPDHVLSVKYGSTVATYDKEADAAYFKVKKGTVAKTIKLQDWLLVDVDKSGALLGVEMLAVSSQIPKKEIASTIRAGKIPVAA